MIGLVIKDFLVLRKSLRSCLLMVVLYTAIAFTGAWSADAVGVLMVAVISILPMSVSAYDQQAKWDTYGLALPVGRTKTVAARYLCVLLLCLGSVLLTAIAGVALYAAGRMEGPAEFMISCAVIGLIAILMNAIMLPFLYKFGPERARIMLLGLMGVLAFLGWMFLLQLGGIAWLKTLEEITPNQAVVFPVAAALAGLALLTVSFLLSRHFYGMKDV